MSTEDLMLLGNSKTVEGILALPALIVPEVVGINGNIYAFRREFEEYTILLRQHEKNEFANFYQKNLQIFSLQHNIF